MTRNTRHNKILEIISNQVVETQDDLVKILRDLDFDVTQATVSRDIKELGLIKILTEDKRYKYAVASATMVLSDKNVDTARSLITNIIEANNLVVVKVVKGTSQFISSTIDQCNIADILGITYGDDTVLIVTKSVDDARIVSSKLESLFGE